MKKNLSDYIKRNGTYFVVDNYGNIIEQFRLKYTARMFCIRFNNSNKIGVICKVIKRENYKDYKEYLLSQNKGEKDLNTK